MKSLWSIAWGGLAAGTLDITYACTEAFLRGSGPTRMLQAIASGLLGRAAFEGGWRTAVLGGLLHYSIALGACAAYFAASRKLSFLLERTVVSGVLYGLVVYFFMRLVVLPLSAIPWQPSWSAAAVLSGFAAHIFCVGLPIAMLVRRFGPPGRSHA